MKSPTYPDARTVINKLLVDLSYPDVRKATHYESATYTVKASHRHRPSARSTRVEIVLSWGRPNYAEREFIRKHKKTASFPLDVPVLTFWPKKKPVAKKK